METLPTHRTTVVFGFLAQQLLGNIKAATGYSLTRILENALAAYADQLQRQAAKQLKATQAAEARREGGNHAESCTFPSNA